MLRTNDLFVRLAEGHAAGITVVTPNRRLAQALNAEFDSYQISRNLNSWEAPDILPLGAFVERQYEDALYSDLGAKLPLLLTPAQEQRLWEEVLAESGLLAIPQAAAQCREAWELLHAWRIGPGPGNEDARAFSEWSRAYAKRTAGEVDAARLPDLVLSLGKEVKTPKRLVAYGFDVMPPRTRELLERLSFEECRPSPVSGKAIRSSFPGAKHELEAAAAWARARLEEGKARIGVVVPDLQRRRKEVARIFSRVMRPDFNLPGAPAAAMPFNVSLGQALTDYPLVEAALDLLELSGRPVPFATASRVIRSPFLGGADAELSSRARLDAKLRRDFDAVVALPKLIAATDGALRRLFESIFSLPRENLRSAGEWARHFSAVLEAAGFPGERALDSAEFQARAKWHEVLGEFSKLERVASPLDFSQAFSVLKRLCADTLFQPESPDAPIQVLGVFESAGLRFDCLWVCGLTDEAWPLAARPNPFLPVALQKKAGIPQASAEASLDLCRRLTQEWLSAASQTILSWPTKDGDRELSPTPLILAVPEGALELPAYPRYRDLLFQSKRIEASEDLRGPPVAKPAVRGGTRILADQAACPFRAFAHYRLHAEALEDPAPGLDARDRGKLVHELMKNVWTELKDSSSLKRDLTPAITRAAEAAIREIGVEGRLAALERTRLEKVAREWLENVEAKRPPFQVVAVEEKRTLQVAGLELSGRIDRMDKVEEGGNEAYVLIDYKGGNVSTRLWEGPRPEDPQLTIYAVTGNEPLAAVTFARLKTGEMKFLGYSKDKDVLPEVKPPGKFSWPGLLAEWKREAESLGTAFAAGDARVDPKNDLKTCRLCDLQTLCRVYEKYSVIGEAD